MSVFAYTFYLHYLIDSPLSSVQVTNCFVEWYWWINNALFIYSASILIIYLIWNIDPEKMKKNIWNNTDLQ